MNGNWIRRNAQKRRIHRVMIGSLGILKKLPTLIWILAFNIRQGVSNRLILSEQLLKRDRLNVVTNINNHAACLQTRHHCVKRKQPAFLQLDLISGLFPVASLANTLSAGFYVEVVENMLLNFRDKNRFT